MRGFGARRALFLRKGVGGSQTWPNFSDGDLTIDGTTVDLAAGSVKDYRDITIINNGRLNIYGAGVDLLTNDGTAPTIIGCRNFTVNTGGKILVRENGLGRFDAGSGPTSFVYSATPPDGAVVTPVSFTATVAKGGSGGQSITAGGGTDTLNFGHGGGGAGSVDGDIPVEDLGWGISGRGSISNQGDNGGEPVGPLINGFSATGLVGDPSETDGECVGSGGSGGTRGLSGGCVYIQAAGTVSVSGVVIDASGSQGGQGGVGGVAVSDDDLAWGGGGGGGAAGGCGGKIIIRYKLGSILAANCTVVGGASGVGGAGGEGFGASGGELGYNGINGTAGSAGSVDIATY